MSRRKRVLFVSSALPSPPAWGFAMRVYQLVRHVAVEHEVTLLTYQDVDQDLSASDLAAHCARVVCVPRGDGATARRRTQQVRSLAGRLPFHASDAWSASMQAAIHDCLAGQPFDVVQVESSTMMCFRFDTSAPVVLDEHNIESELLTRYQKAEASVGRRAFHRVEAGKYRAFETRAWRRVAGIAVTSQREVGEVAARAPRALLSVVPNGVDPEVFAPGPAADVDRGRDLVFTGLLSYRPNVDGVRWLLGDVLPLVRRTHPDVTVTVIGSGPDAVLDELRGAGVEVTGRVPDVRPYLDRAACAVVPIRFGGGTRLKVVEALSMAKPMVSTAVGCEGIDVRDGEHLLVADSPADFAAAVVRLLDDQHLRRRLAVAARRLAVEQYSWRQSAAQLLELYGRVEGGARA